MMRGVRSAIFNPLISEDESDALTISERRGIRESEYLFIREAGRGSRSQDFIVMSVKIDLISSGVVGVKLSRGVPEYFSWYESAL